MSDSSPILIPTSTSKTAPSRAAEWSDEDRESAFELWMSNGKPPIAQVVRLAVSELGKAIPHETLRGWHAKYRWDEEYDRRLAAVAPHLMIRTALQLTVGAVGASKYIEDVWTAGSDGKAKAAFDKDRYAAAISTVGTVGFSPGSKSRPSLPTPNDSSAVDDTDDPATALARITERRQRSQ